MASVSLFVSEQCDLPFYHWAASVSQKTGGEALVVLPLIVYEAVKPLLITMMKTGEHLYRLGENPKHHGNHGIRALVSFGSFLVSPILSLVEVIQTLWNRIFDSNASHFYSSRQEDAAILALNIRQKKLMGCFDKVLSTSSTTQSEQISSGITECQRDVVNQFASWQKNALVSYPGHEEFENFKRIVVNKSERFENLIQAFNNFHNEFKEDLKDPVIASKVMVIFARRSIEINAFKQNEKDNQPIEGWSQEIDSEIQLLTKYITARSAAIEGLDIRHNEIKQEFSGAFNDPIIASQWDALYAKHLAQLDQCQPVDQCQPAEIAAWLVTNVSDIREAKNLPSARIKALFTLEAKHEEIMNHYAEQLKDSRSAQIVQKIYAEKIQYIMSLYTAAELPTLCSTALMETYEQSIIAAITEQQELNKYHNHFRDQVMLLPDLNKKIMNYLVPSTACDLDYSILCGEAGSSSHSINEEGKLMFQVRIPEKDGTTTVYELSKELAYTNARDANWNMLRSLPLVCKSWQKTMPSFLELTGFYELKTKTPKTWNLLVQLKEHCHEGHLHYLQERLFKVKETSKPKKVDKLLIILKYNKQGELKTSCISPFFDSDAQVKSYLFFKNGLLANSMGWGGWDLYSKEARALRANSVVDQVGDAKHTERNIVLTVKQLMKLEGPKVIQLESEEEVDEIELLTT